VSNLARIYGALCKTAFFNSTIQLTLLPPAPVRFPFSLRPSAGREREDLPSSVSSLVSCSLTLSIRKLNTLAPVRLKPYGGIFLRFMFHVSSLLSYAHASARSDHSRRYSALGIARFYISQPATWTSRKARRENIFIYLDCRGVTAAQCKSTRNRYKFSHMSLSNEDTIADVSACRTVIAMINQGKRILSVSGKRNSVLRSR
jgi:hypothetical protein